VEEDSRHFFGVSLQCGDNLSLLPIKDNGISVYTPGKDLLRDENHEIIALRGTKPSFGWDECPSMLFRACLLHEQNAKMQQRNVVYPLP